MSMLSKEIAAYNAIRNELEIDHLGKWVVIHDEVLVGIYDSFDDAASNAVEQFGRGPYLIREVGAPPLALPASVFYRPTLDHAET